MIDITEDNRWERRTCRVKIRRDLAEVKPEAEQLDGKVIVFTPGWPMTEDDTSIYVGEWAMLIQDIEAIKAYPGAPSWIASGDLMPLEESASVRN